MSYYFVEPQLPSLNAALFPFVVSPVIDGVILWGTDRFISKLNQKETAIRKLLVVATRATAFVLSILNGLIAIRALEIGTSMSGRYLAYHQFAWLGLLAQTTPWIFMLCHIVVMESVFLDGVSRKCIDGNLKDKAVSLKQWICFSFKAFNPLFLKQINEPVFV